MINLLQILQISKKNQSNGALGRGFPGVAMGIARDGIAREAPGIPREAQRFPREVPRGAQGNPRELGFPQARDPLAAWMVWLGWLGSMEGPMCY